MNYETKTNSVPTNKLRAFQNKLQSLPDKQKLFIVYGVALVAFAVILPLKIWEFKQKNAASEWSISPTFPEGDKGFDNYIGSMQKYPKQAQEHNITGEVLVEFAVDKDGSITEIKVLKGIGYGCDEEAVRVLAACPKWTPGMTDKSKPVKVYYTMTFYF